MQPTQEPQLRKLGIPTTLQNGNVHVLYEHPVCKEGEILSVQQAHVLKMMGVRESLFTVKKLATSYEDKVVRCDEDMD
jgi:mRNA turnover protein 4